MTSRVSVSTNEGEGLIMAMRLGTALGNMREAWWMPVVSAPTSAGESERPAYLFASERARPRSIMINKKGRRFTNEAANYNVFGAAFHEQDVARFEYANLPCWFIYDQAHLDKFGFIDTHPGQPAPNWVTKAASLLELADKLGVPSGPLAKTVQD